MTSDNPFAEATDTDRTVIRPNPVNRPSGIPPYMPPPMHVGRERGLAQTAQHGRQHGDAPAIRSPLQVPPEVSDVLPKEMCPKPVPAVGIDALNAAASPLFSLIGRIRNRAQHTDPSKLRERVITEINVFESTALQSGVAANTVKVARYALCATIDDVVLNTPWGGQSIWTQQSMVGTFHKETHGGDRFYELLKRLEQAPAQNRSLLELIYVCLSLGFEGRLRVEGRGTERHVAVRGGLARLIRTHRGPATPDLSPNWRGVDVGHRPLSPWSAVCFSSAIAIGAICLAFFGFSYALSGDTERLRGQLSALNFDGPVTLARTAPPPPAPPPLPQTETLQTFLAPEIEQGLVEVFTDANTVTVRILGEGMFRPASDVLEPAYDALVERIAQAVNQEEGRIIVAGHSDNLPIRSARFPSNLHLSLARAKSVMERVAPALSDPVRISAEGRADKEPIASNQTAEGRARNRRIDIILVKVG